MHQTTLIVCILFIRQWISVASVIESRSITEKQGRDVLLSCRFEYLHDRDRVMWSKDGVVLSVNEEISGDRKKYQIKNKYDLLIKKVDDQDSGRYLCQNFDQVLSMNVILTVLTQPTKPELQQTNQSLIENSRGLFICTSKGGNPLPTFHWFINQIRINDSFFNVYPNAQQSRSELSLPLEKRFHNGLLTCQIHNQALDAPLVASQTLNIQYKPDVTLQHGQTVVSNLNLLVIENEPLTIHCQIQSNPPLTKSITWLKNKVLLPSITSSSITFQTIKRHDDGEYACLASNAVGQGQSSVHIRVQYTPLVQLNGGGYINENQRLILVCQAESYPSVHSYEWFRNNDRLETNTSTSTLIIEKVSKDHSGTYVCLVKNSLKYANGSSIEKSNQTQTQVMVQYIPKVTTLTPIIATDLYADQIELSCQIDSFPPAKVSWSYRNRPIVASEKYVLVQNESDSTLIIKQMQSDLDYGWYSCHAANKLGEQSTMIQLRSKDVPETPKDLKLISRTYSSISVQWTPGFDGGWPQRFSLGLDQTVRPETNESSFTFTHLKHAQSYNITVQAINLLGQSAEVAFLRVQTDNVPIRQEDLPVIEYASIHLSAKTIHYRLNNNSFATLKAPLCLRMDIENRTNLCPRIVTSSGFFTLDEKDLKNIQNVSLCLDHYEEYCSRAVPVAIKQDASISWIFILIASLTMVSCLILLGLIVFCVIIKRRRRQNADQSIASSKKRSSQHPIVSESSTSTVNNPKQHFTNLTYPEQQPTPTSYSKLTDMEKFDRYQGSGSTNQRQLSSITSGSSDPIVSNPNSSSLCGSDQLTVTDLNPTDLSSIQNELLGTTTPYTSFGFPFYSTATAVAMNTLQSNKDDLIESGYSTPLKSHPMNKKTVYEVVV